MNGWKWTMIACLSWGAFACAPGDRSLKCLDNLECGPGEACIDGECVLPDCQTDADCPAGESCLGSRCQLDVECTQDGDCALGSICQDGSCRPGCRNERDCPDEWICQDNQCVQPGCQQDADCTPPEVCNLATRQCETQTDCCGGCQQNYYCDTLACQCVFACASDADCPAGFTCRPDGKCACTQGSCPEGTHCDTQTGTCEKDQLECQTAGDCPQGWVCNPSTYTCESPGNLIEGDFCFQDDECDQAAGLLCDSQVMCYGCMLADPDFNPTFTCRHECALTVGSCPLEDRVCKYRHMGLVGLCIPHED